MSNKPINSMKDTEKFRRMTEQLRLTHTDEEVANYLRWILSAASPGKLHVVEETEYVPPDTWCSVCICVACGEACGETGEKEPYPYCPYCRRKVKRTKQ